MISGVEEMKTYKTWAVRPPVSGEDKTRSLRNGLLWTLAVVQIAYVCAIAGVYIAAEMDKNGEAWHDLGVALGREVVVNRVEGYWLLTTVVLGAVSAVLYFVLKDRWNRS
jgi:hypothetical protein